MRIRQLLGIISAIMFTITILLLFLYAPIEAQMGVVQKIFYFHVPAWWNSFLAYLVAFIASIWYLKTRQIKYDALAVSAVEIGLIFSTIGLTSGPIWAKSAWNTWWTWEPRLTTALILWSIYMGYLILRSALEGERKRVFSAVMGIVGFIDVPIVYYSVKIWSRTMQLHPRDMVAPNRVELASGMKLTFFVSLITFTIFYFYLLHLRNDIERLSNEVDELQDELERQER